MVDARWAEDDGEVVGYMCKTDFVWELGGAAGGNVVYPSVRDLKRQRPCTKECGIVEVRVRLAKIIEEGTEL